MEKEIRIRVEKSEIKSDSVFGGIQGEGGARTLKISFDGEWDGLSKKITFYDGAMQNSVSVVLTDDKKTDGEYCIKIPAEPLATGGKLTYVIDGAADGIKQRSVQSELRVKYAAGSSNNSAADITPTEAQQLAASVNTLSEKIDGVEEVVADKADKTEIPTKLSELENDSVYLTQAKAIANFVQKGQISTALAKKADKEELDSLNTSVEQALDEIIALEESILTAETAEISDGEESL